MDFLEKNKETEENLETESVSAPVKVRSVRKKVVKKAVLVNGENNSNNLNNNNEEDNNMEYEEAQNIERPQDIVYINKLSCLTFEELLEFANSYGLKRDANIRRQELMHLILRTHLVSGGKIEADGTLEVLPDGFGFLRSQNMNYLSGQDDIYSANSNKTFWIKDGRCSRR